MEMARPPLPIPAANSEPHEIVEEFTPVYSDVRVLHPSRRNGAKWFKNNTEVSTCVRKIIEGCFKGPWYSWKRVPSFYKDAWFTTFKSKFEWEASIDGLVKTNFEKLAASRLRGMVSLAKANRNKPEWILNQHWTVMMTYWRTTTAKEKSDKARSSRLCDRNGLGPHRHRSGSRSYAKVQDFLEANNEDSSFIAVMKKTHQKSDGTFVDEKARLISEKYDELVQECLLEMNSNGEGLTESSFTQLEKNELYKKAVGLSKQGRVFGLGSIQTEVSIPFSTSSGFQQSPEEVETLTNRVKELETQVEKSRVDNLLFTNRLEAIEKIFFPTNDEEL